jgi:hypothetical protein
MCSRTAMVGMSVRAFIRCLLAVAVILPVSTVSAQIYKWVDEHGVTNYSNQQPTDPKTPQRVELVESNISIYTPDQSLLQAVEAFRIRSNEIGLKAAAPEASPSNQYATPVYVPVPVASDPCGGYREAYCNEFYTGYYPYAPVVGHRLLGRRHKRIPPIRLKPGTIAGQVVGMRGYIPGNSANARRFGPTLSRSMSRHAVEPSFTGGRRPVQLPSRFR